MTKSEAKIYGQPGYYRVGRSVQNFDDWYPMNLIGSTWFYLLTDGSWHICNNPAAVRLYEVFKTYEEAQAALDLAIQKQKGDSHGKNCS